MATGAEQRAELPRMEFGQAVPIGSAVDFEALDKAIAEQQEPDPFPARWALGGIGTWHLQLTNNIKPKNLVIPHRGPNGSMELGVPDNFFAPDVVIEFNDTVEDKDKDITCSIRFDEVGSVSSDKEDGLDDNTFMYWRNQGEPVDVFFTRESLNDPKIKVVFDRE